MPTPTLLLGNILTLLLAILLNFSNALLATTNLMSASSNPSLQWGPYRPNLYIGIRPRIPNSLLMGLMWSNIDDSDQSLKNLRHTCEQDEGMAGYGWTSYDARKGGMHVVNDTGNKLDLITRFSKNSNNDDNHNWDLRVTGIPRTGAQERQNTTLIFYLGVEDPESKAQCHQEHEVNASSSSVSCTGTIDHLGEYHLRVVIPTANTVNPSTSTHSLTVDVESIWRAKSIFMDLIRRDASSKGVISDKPGTGNLHFIQLTFEGDVEFDVLFSPKPEPQAPLSDSLTKDIEDASNSFHQRFNAVYSPQPPFDDEKHVKFSQSLLSNLMGGIGYFHGTSKVEVSSAPEYAETEENFWEKAGSARKAARVDEVGPYSLFTSVPSRPFFPRGFLWDEGFQLRIIMEWDMDLALEIVTSWFDLMDDDGWIAREQILGPEARSKVPLEFQTQYPHYANPPTLFVIVHAFVERLIDEASYTGVPSRFISDQSAGKGLLISLYPKMKKHYDWFRRTQAGTNLTGAFETEHGYRWRGRTPQHILTSGLDDYPRSQPPHPDELHVDALCWVGVMAEVLNKLANFLGEETDESLFSLHHRDVRWAVDSIHWSEAEQTYCDTTRGGDDQQLKKVCHKGYISLFPFFTGMMGPDYPGHQADHPHLEAVLDLISDPAELRSPYGLRSLSLKDEYYGTGENYWRGPIWININYMVLERLLELAQSEGPHRSKACKTYIDLRYNLVNTVYNSWDDTGFAWEQYNPDTGNGQRTQHFTGWTALIVRIMAMPDLRPHYAAEYIAQPVVREGWSFKSILVVMVCALCIWYLFRRRLIGLWRWIARS